MLWVDCAADWKISDQIFAVETESRAAGYQIANSFPSPRRIFPEAREFTVCLHDAVSCGIRRNKIAKSEELIDSKSFNARAITSSKQLKADEGEIQLYPFCNTE